MQRGFVVPLIIIGVIVLSLIAGGAYYLGRTSSTPQTVQNQQIITSSSQPAPSSAPVTLRASLPLTARTVSYTKTAEGDFYLRYKDHFYESSNPDSYDDPKETNLINFSDYTWNGIVEPPPLANIAFPGYIPTDEVFGFRVFPKKDKFLFILRLDKPGEGNRITNEYKVYVFEPTTNTLTNIFSTLSVDTTNSTIPRIRLISPDGKFIAFNMHPCWNCDASPKDIMLWKLDNSASKKISWVSYFNWKENGEYEYKEFKTIPFGSPGCTEPGMLDYCPVDPAELPLLQSKF